MMPSCCEASSVTCEGVVSIHSAFRGLTPLSLCPIDEMFTTRRCSLILGLADIRSNREDSSHRET